MISANVQNYIENTSEFEVLVHFQALLSANFCFLFSLFFVFHVACCSDHQWKYWLFFWVVVVICFKWSLNLTWNCWKVYLGVFSRSYSPVLQGINPDQIFLVYLWDCNTEYNKKSPKQSCWCLSHLLLPCYPLACSSVKEINYVSLIQLFSWQIHVICFLSSYYSWGAYKLLNNMFQSLFRHQLGCLLFPNPFFHSFLKMVSWFSFSSPLCILEKFIKAWKTVSAGSLSPQDWIY